MDNKKYSFIKPQIGFVVLKKVEEEKGIGMVRSGQTEDNAYARIVSVYTKSEVGYNEKDKTEGSLKVGDLIMYNEYEGQEMFKYGKIKEDGIILIKEANILAVIQ